MTFVFANTKRKKERSKSYFHWIMPCINWLAPTSKSGTAGSRVVSAGGRVVREAGLEESTVGGESVQIKVSKVNVWPYFQQPVRCAARNDQTGASERSTRAHPKPGCIFGEEWSPPRTIFEDDRKFALLWSASSLQRIWHKNTWFVERTSHAGQISVRFVA